MGFAPNYFPLATDEVLAKIRGRVVQELVHKKIVIGVAGRPELTPSKTGTINGKQVDLVMYWGPPVIPASVHDKFKKDELHRFILNDRLIMQ